MINYDNLPETTPEQREYKAFKLRQQRTALTLKIKALETSSDSLQLPNIETK